MAFRRLALIVVAAAAVPGVGATELTPANWDEQTAGKSIFVKFLAPWCGHCKSLKPDWDKLIEEFKDSPISLVADVDCTAEGKDLCEKHGVRGYPTIKYGDPGDLQDYQGGRSYDDLKKFAEENLGPTCGPTNLDLCDSKTREKLEKYMQMTAGRLEAKIRNAIKAVQEEVPLMKKTLAHVKAAPEGKKEL